jgi:nitrate reductase NapD
MNVSGVLLRANPEKIENVLDTLTELTDVEVHAVTEDGRIILTIEQSDEGKASETFLGLYGLNGVVSTSLVCTYVDD